MTATLYPLYKTDILKASTTNLDLDNTTANIAPYALLVTASYVYSAAHQYKDVSVTTNIVGVTGGIQITTPTITVNANNAKFDGDDCTFVSVAAGTPAAGIIIYRQNAAATNMSLVSFYDTPTGGLPVTPNGGNITIQWNASGIFELSDVNAKCDIEHIGGLLYSYHYKYPGSPRYFGVIAQEIEQLLPEAVKSFGGLKHVDRRIAAEIRG